MIRLEAACRHSGKSIVTWRRTSVSIRPTTYALGPDAPSTTHILQLPAVNSAFLRGYHCQTPVHGYKPRPKTSFEPSSEAIESRIRQSNFYRFVEAYRDHGHKVASTNPYKLLPLDPVSELDLKRYGLQLEDGVSPAGILNDSSVRTVQDAQDFLRKVYCGPLSVELTCVNEEEREWLSKRVEALSSEAVSNAEARTVGIDLLRSQAFDNFLGAKFVTFKRYGCEGAESSIAFFRELFNSAAKAGLKQLVVGMPHRGRLNVLTGLLQLDPRVIFQKIRGISEFPTDAKCTSDVISHLTSSVDLKIDDKNLHVTVLYNPSHLEAVNPVSMGKTRGRQQSLRDGDYSESDQTRWSDKVLNLQIHGDAAFPGQGINQETLALSRLPHFEVGGSLHLIVNNQLGFTTPNDRGSSSRYGSDLAKFVEAPVIHVSGDKPEMVIKATRLAVDYQRQFRKDVFINMNCFRRWGHNEVDDPTFTNPVLYKTIHSLRSVPDTYADELVQRGILTSQEVEKVQSDYSTWLNNSLKDLDNFSPERSYFKNHWSEFSQAPNSVTVWDTGVDVQLLRHIAQKSVQLPSGFNIHPHLLKIHVAARVRRIAEGTSIDWGTAEAMAMGSLLSQGFDVRISGQDVGRATFSHRHAMLVDQNTNDIYIPLNSMVEDQKANLEVVNSPLSEEAVLAFEYGMSIENPNKLVIWEAQFGDFFNGAQIIIDTFVTSGETKWMQCSGLTMLLPHGYDGMGPEHSSCRVERFLQMTDSSETKPDGEDINFQVANPTTAAQYFHLLRRQMLRKWRKPLIVVAPKILIRMAEGCSSLMDMAPSTSFVPVIGDTSVDPAAVKRVILVTGKHYYALVEKRKELKRNDVAIIRVEELCPFPTHHLNAELDKYKYAKSFVWSQEEPRNMGAWSFIKPRFENLLARKISYSGREVHPTPAVGIGQIHQEQAKYVISQPFVNN